MHIYRADVKDLTACLTLNGSYETDYVWQVTQQEDDGEVITRLRPARLPRTMRVPYPSWGEALLAHQARGHLILVAAEAARGARLYRPGVPAGRRCRLDPPPGRGARRSGGRGSATTLLARAMQHARQHGLSHVMTAVQSKNYPAISFLQRHGFTFCGYNERYYRNQDIALYFAVWIVATYGNCTGPDLARHTRFWQPDPFLGDRDHGVLAVWVHAYPQPAQRRCPDLQHSAGLCAGRVCRRHRDPAG